MQVSEDSILHENAATKQLLNEEQEEKPVSVNLLPSTSSQSQIMRTTSYTQQQPSSSFVQQPASTSTSYQSYIPTSSNVRTVDSTPTLVQESFSTGEGVQQQPLFVTSSKAVSVTPIMTTTSSSSLAQPIATIHKHASDRYGHLSIVKTITFPPVDVPCYIKSSDEQLYMELPYEKTHMALDQQVVVHKRGFFEGLFGKRSGYSRSKWIFTNEGYIVSEVNRHMMLTVKKSRVTNEWLVIARNTEIIGGTIARWRMKESEVSPLIPKANKHMLFNICLDADPTLIMDIQKNRNIDTAGYNVVLRRNLNATDMRQKWYFKFKA